MKLQIWSCAKCNKRYWTEPQYLAHKCMTYTEIREWNGLAAAKKWAAEKGQTVWATKRKIKKTPLPPREETIDDAREVARQWLETHGYAGVSDE